MEEHGIATVNVSTGRDLTAQVRPPRSLFVNHPMGNPFGRPGEVACQREILMAALSLLETCREPGALVDLDTDWGEKLLTLFELEGKFRAGDPDPATGKQPY